MQSQQLKQLIALLLAALLSGCGSPVPPEKSAYVGDWQASMMALSITQDGSVRYARKENGVSKSMKGPLQGFSGDNFMVGIGPVSSTFSVTTPPHQVGDEWKMTVEGVELTRH